MTNEFPGAGPYKDRHSKTRWRYRRGKKTIQLPGDPAENAAFEAAYMAAVEGRPVPKSAAVVRLPGAAAPHSFKAAWRVLRSDYAEWRALGPDAKELQTRLAEQLLTMPLVEGEPVTFGDVAVEHLRRKHIKALIARKAATAPHSATHLLRVVRKLCRVALDQEWIDVDPSYEIRHRPEYGGWKAWPAEMLDRFEARWTIGTTPRLVYSLALYFGHRRSDVTRVRPGDLEIGAGNVVQQKTGKALWIPMHPNLRDVLDAVPNIADREFVVMTYRNNPFSPEMLDERFRFWRNEAGVPKGYSLHGLRKTLGKSLAEHGATTRELMEILGHDKMEHAELYSREAEQRILASSAMQKLMTWRRPKAG